jgi:acetyl-CoA carboxylase biotin carboxyl carrier protein
MMIEEMVKELLLSIQGSSVTEVEYETNGVRLRLVRRLKTGEAQPIVSNAPDCNNGLEPPDAGPKTHTISANMHGTFYQAASPTEPPFVEPGQQIKEGQQIAVLEAMKMLHEVEADITGIVIKVLVENGAAVEPGTALFTVESTDV